MKVEDAIKSGKFYTYVHIRNDNNKVFYVGKGKGRRVLEKGRHRNQWWNRIAEKHGYRIEIMFIHFDEQSALDAEMFFIKSFKLQGHNLVNMTDGGDGCMGLIMSDEAKEKCRIKKTGKNNPMFGRTGDTNPSYKGPILATNTITKEEKLLECPDDMKSMGFRPASIYRILGGKTKRHTHKGFTFKRIQ